MQHVLNALDKISAVLGQIAALHPMGGMHGSRLQAIAADLAAARASWGEAMARAEQEIPQGAPARRGRPRKSA